MRRRCTLIGGIVSIVAIIELLSSAVVFGGQPTPISGTLFKGPAVGGISRFVSQNVLQIRDELGYGTVTGGILSGSPAYTFDEQMVNFNDQSGTLHGSVAITTINGSTITLGLIGFFHGVTPTAQTITITGTWVVLSATGPDSGLHGEGQFSAIVVFQAGPQFGQTQGAFSGFIL